MRPREVLTSNKGKREIARERESVREREREGELESGREGDVESGREGERYGRTLKLPASAKRTTDWRRTIGAGSIAEFSKEDDPGAAS